MTSGDALTTGGSATSEFALEIVLVHHDHVELPAGKLGEELQSGHPCHLGGLEG